MMIGRNEPKKALLYKSFFTGRGELEKKGKSEATSISQGVRAAL